jgi:class 3 adenylate cyclase/CHASE2 domain-containing sensor protein
LCCSGFFVFIHPVNLRSAQLAPLFTAAFIVVLVCFLQSQLDRGRSGLLLRLEWVTYDWRVQVATNFPQKWATNLAAVYLDEETVHFLKEAYETDWPYPRQFHGRVLRELSAQNAKAVGFDVLFGELRQNDSPMLESDGSSIASDYFFGQMLRQSDHVVLGSGAEVFPPPLFATNAGAVAHILAHHDRDGILRRVRPFTDHPVHGRRWHMGFALAARELDLDLDGAVVGSRRLIISSRGGEKLEVPLDPNGYFPIDWILAWNDMRILKASYGNILSLDELRVHGTEKEYQHYLNQLRMGGMSGLVGETPFAGKLIVVGSIIEGNNLSDIGATPLRKQDYLVSTHWNVANSLITGKFIRHTSGVANLLMVGLLGCLTALLTWRLRAWAAALLVLLLGLVYMLAGILLYTEFRWTIPMVLPLTGGLGLVYLTVGTYRLIFEQTERRRIKSVFSKIVAPEVVDELLNARKLSLGGARRRISVSFADIRGFTELTDSSQARAEQYARDNHLSAKAAEDHFNTQAAETLANVNLYLSTVADLVKKHHGTLDKYIGDCVMAFWGAPATDLRHASHCVQAAVDAQRAVYDLNKTRSSENKRREQENFSRRANGRPELPLLPILSLGVGISSGMATVGLMGSDDHIFSYTVFGQEVNLASRLEVVAGRGRVIISESTFLELQATDEELASQCVPLTPVTVKGIRDQVKIYEILWKLKTPETGIDAARGEAVPASPQPV